MKAYFSAQIREANALKIVVLTSRFPFPIEKGDKLRMYHQLKGLAEHHEVHLISIAHSAVSKDALEHIELLCSSVSIFYQNKLSSSLRAGSAIYGNMPFQVKYFFSRSASEAIAQQIRSIEPDVIYCQLARMSEYVKDLAYPKVLDFMDAFSLNYRRRASHEKSLLRIFFETESRRLVKYEKSMTNSFDRSVIISAADSEAITSEAEIDVISNGLDTSFFTPVATTKEFDLVLVGNMGYHPNVLAAKYLVRNILPKLQTVVKLQIAGARPNRIVRSLSADNVEVTGWIDDIRSAYSISKLFIAPIFSGAGQQNKILEAMAMEMICITTPIVNDGIGAKDGKEILIANNAHEFAEKIDNVLNNMDSYKSIAVNARNFVKANFSWEHENGKLNELLVATSNCKRNERK